MHVEDIKAALRKQGWTLTGIAKELGVGPSAISHALTRQRSRRVEKVIAAKLGLSPREIWPQRYKGGATHESVYQQAGSVTVPQSQQHYLKKIQIAGPVNRGHSLGSH
ncbi:helix-turn-helix domain-containing protein [Nodosilinea sp. PGN35]|uniref:helix-turn-helix domain-containing protein n=1 Tax=Nodosilinea sp. PGN35 TaxID=3020489 RepID=UPI0023B2580B|nr:helix-turn-helix domain-containing protein [Nodosilinea sp. TSF1-S3]MDF0366109.1 helix-turn-helix domain-containing protein [Nodosilinea sp. TSF1-S3]